MLMPSFKKIAAIFMLVSAWTMDAGAANVQPQPATVFDLPDETPGLQVIEDPLGMLHPDLSYQQINAVGAFCVHVIVPDTNPAAHIYFPRDGRQPTTEEAVVWSCANVDAGNINSPITEWYMKVFGVIPFNGVNYIQAGWTDLPPAAQGEEEVAPQPQQIARIIDANNLADNPKAIFINDFRKIASTSVGRVLLYRILIEIRRHQQGGNIGRMGDDVDSNDEILIRNSLRSIIIDLGAPKFTFSGELFIDGYLTTTNYAIGDMAETGERGKYNHIIRNENYSDITLFHEMNHWYHALRHIDRIFNELNNMRHIRHFDGMSRAHNEGNAMATHEDGEVVPVGSEAYTTLL